MEEKKTLLILRLEGALQSWGENAKWDHRDTSIMPSKSGIVGLLGCALGVPRNSDELRKLSQDMNFAVRADRPGVITTDFQTIEGFPLMTAAGSPRPADKNTIISPRDYINDGIFTVVIDVGEEWIDKLVAALQSPKWCMYLGRKNCVPSRPVFECISDSYASLLDAVQNYPPAMRAAEEMAYECEADNNTAAIFRPDELSGPNRQFDLRKVWRGTVSGGTACT